MPDTSGGADAGRCGRERTGRGALGRDTGGAATALSYEGSTGQLVGTSTYTWSPDDTLTGTASAGSPGTVAALSRKQR